MSTKSRVSVEKDDNCQEIMKNNLLKKRVNNKYCCFGREPKKMPLHFTIESHGERMKING
jgi:hypothetical protein